MPPQRKFARRGAGAGRCFPHCFIWWGGDGKIVIGCAHCPTVNKTVEVRETYDEETLRKQIRSSREGHKQLCRRPIYTP